MDYIVVALTRCMIVHGRSHLEKMMLERAKEHKAISFHVQEYGRNRR
jgi:hypothetical protein